MAIIIKKEPEQKTITIAELLPEVIAIRKRGMRVCQICAAWVNAQFELSYSFANDGNYLLLTLRVVIDKDVAVPSITPIYPSAVFYENEMKELFGVKVENISTDYRDKFYRIEEKTPFGPESEGE